MPPPLPPRPPYAPGAWRYVFADRAALLVARDAWCADPTAAALTYGPINAWDVSAVTSFAFLFCASSSTDSWAADCNPDCSTFNDYIGDWDTGSVTDMRVRARRTSPPLPNP